MEFQITALVSLPSSSSSSFYFFFPFWLAHWRLLSHSRLKWRLCFHSNAEQTSLKLASLIIQRLSKAGNLNVTARDCASEKWEWGREGGARQWKSRKRAEPESRSRGGRRRAVGRDKENSEKGVIGFEKPFNISTYGLVRPCASVEIVKKAQLCTVVYMSAVDSMSSVLDIFLMTLCAILFFSTLCAFCT